MSVSVCVGLWLIILFPLRDLCGLCERHLFSVFPHSRPGCPLWGVPSPVKSNSKSEKNFCIEYDNNISCFFLCGPAPLREIWLLFFFSFSFQPSASPPPLSFEPSALSFSPLPNLLLNPINMPPAQALDFTAQFKIPLDLFIIENSKTIHHRHRSARHLHHFSRIQI